MCGAIQGQVYYINDTVYRINDTGVPHHWQLCRINDTGVLYQWHICAILMTQVYHIIDTVVPY